MTLRRLDRLCDALATVLASEGAGGPSADARLPRRVAEELVHRAVGLVAEQLGTPMAEAAARVRRHAYDTGP